MVHASEPKRHRWEPEMDTWHCTGRGAQAGRQAQGRPSYAGSWSGPGQGWVRGYQGEWVPSLPWSIPRMILILAVEPVLSFF